MYVCMCMFVCTMFSFFFERRNENGKQGNKRNSICTVSILLFPSQFKLKNCNKEKGWLP